MRGSLLVLPSEGAVPSFVTDRADEFVRVRFLGTVPEATRRAIETAVTQRRGPRALATAGRHLTGRPGDALAAR